MENILWSALIAFVVGCLVVYKKSLTLPAASLAAFMIMLLSFFVGLKNMTFLLVAFFAISAADHAVKNKKAPLAEKDKEEEKHGRRFIQVAANGLVACLMTLIYALTKKEVFIIAYIAVLAESLADSLASDIGIFSKKAPIDICRLKRTEPGISGGISLLGSVSALAGSVFMAVYMALIRGFVLKEFLIIIAAPMIGMFFDSVLGSLFQIRYRCSVCGKLTEKKTHCKKLCERVKGPRFLDNNAVNFMGNLMAAAAAYLMYSM
ncbi:MAG: DUF92 domain-containing protein [Christensenellaceae bacterium]|nr:DUF92 domain-containing protein [Christensenellaceae bacterium]